jgi:hypothetical protein
MSLPIFDGGRLRSQLGAADAGYDTAVEQYNQTIVGALKDVADQVVRIRSLETQANDADRSVTAAHKNYDLAKEGYRRGLTDYLNVLVAQNQLLRAQEGVARVQAERLGAHASLMTALGGGLADPADGPKTDETLPAHGKGKTVASSDEAATSGKGANATAPVSASDTTESAAADDSKTAKTMPPTTNVAAGAQASAYAPAVQ